MRSSLNFALFAALAATLAATLAPALSWAEFPGRKSGLWESVSTGAGMPETKVKECVDQAADKAAVGNPKSPPGQKCKVDSSQGTASGFEAQISCDMPGTKMVVKSSGAGDFNSAVTYTVDTSFEPPFMGQSSSRITINAKYLGACPVGVQPGDVEMQNGVKYSRADQERMAKQAQEAMNSPEMQAAMKRAGSAQ